MTVETDADRATMFADFDAPVSFSPGPTWPDQNDDTATINGIFDSEFVEIPGQDMSAESRTLMFTGRSIDLVDAVHNSMIERSDGKIYKVISVEPDGTGITTLGLEGPR